MTSSPADNKQFITRYLAALSGRPKTEEAIARFVSDQALADHIRYVEAAFPEYELVADEIVAERDLVVVRATFRGTHKASFAGIEATGKNVSAPLMVMYRIAQGRIVEHWLQFDAAQVLAQLREPVAAE